MRRPAELHQKGGTALPRTAEHFGISGSSKLLTGLPKLAFQLDGERPCAGAVRNA